MRQHPKLRQASGQTGSRDESARWRPRDAHLVAALSLVLLLIHEVLYRQTVGGEYPFFGLISHAGSDLVIMGMTFTLATALIERARSPRRSPARNLGADRSHASASSPTASR